jgi:L-lactate dehydrogenase (cytochrome)
MNPSYPSIELLARRARQRMPGFAYDYLAGGCMAEVNLHKNTSDIRAVELRPTYLRDYRGALTSRLPTELPHVGLDLR